MKMEGITDVECGCYSINIIEPALGSFLLKTSVAVDSSRAQARK
jgi:hypothetical protein